MTNIEEVEEPSCDPRMAASLAMFLVGQVLDEAYVIANTVYDSGTPWSLKKMKKNHINDVCERNLTFTVSKGDCIEEIKSECPLSPIVTSTPQKGQGDEEFETVTELTKSTSMFINHLFDLRDAEDLPSCDNPPNDSEADLTAEATVIIESCINMATERTRETIEEIDDVEGSVHNSSYSFLTDATLADDFGDFNICTEQNECGSSKQTKLVAENAMDDTNQIEVCSCNETLIGKSDICPYENVFLTLNRDYEQYSDEEPVLQDPRVAPLQEIELAAGERAAECDPLVNIPEDAMTSEESTSAIPRKSKLVHRCRLHGERILSCLRGWLWRRKPERKCKVSRVPSVSRGLGAPSPRGRRAASLREPRRAPPAPSPRKFNTVNEAFVHSSRWKHFGFRVNFNEDV